MRVVQALNLNVVDLGARPIYPGGFVLDHGKYSLITVAVWHGWTDEGMALTVYSRMLLL